MSDDQGYKRLLRKAYRVAKKEGYILTKSRRAISPQNCGALMLIDPGTNVPVLGWDHDATPEEVLDYFGLLEGPRVHRGEGNAVSAKGDCGREELAGYDDCDPY